MAALEMSAFPLDIIRFPSTGTYASRIENTRNRGMHSFALTTGVTTSILFKMRGWNAATSSYETWIVGDPNGGPPSGATLQGIAIAALITNPSDAL